MRTLVVGDIHGKLALLNRLLAEATYQAGADKLVLIGDLVDRGEDSRGVVARALELRNEAPDYVTILKGNHEAMMVAALARPESEQAELWFYNGGIETLQSYMDENGSLNVPIEHLDFIEGLPTWHEDEHAIYVHAGLPEGESGQFTHPGSVADNPELYWARNRHFFAEYRGKTVVFGHTITGMIFGEREQVWQQGDLIGVDTGAYLTGVLSAIELPSRKVFSVSEKPEVEHQRPAFGARFKLWG